MNNLIKNKKTVFIAMTVLFAIGIIGVVYFYNQSNLNDNNENIVEDSFSKNIGEQIDDKKEEKDEQQIIEEEIYIHITGEIKNEGVITLKKGCRIVDAIEKAGGVTESADLSKLNLAYVLSDGQKLIIPCKDNSNEETLITSDGGRDIIQGNVNEKSRRININTANQTELETIAGVGPSLAGKIVDYRKINGKFQSKEELKNVAGIGEAKYETIKEAIDI